MEVVRFLLDTNTLAAAARLEKRVLRMVEDHEGQCAASALSLHEMEWGLAQLGPGKTRAMVEEFLKIVYRELPILPYDAAAARWHAKNRSGRKILLDEMIAATAATQSLVLVTRNSKDFQRFRIPLESW